MENAPIFLENIWKNLFFTNSGSAASLKTMETLSWIDGDCVINDAAMLEDVSDPNVNLFEDKGDNEKSHLARQYRYLLPNFN